MARVGLVGGLGPESTIDYYRRILETWRRTTPDSAPSIIIDSLDVRHALALIENDREGLVAYLLASIHRLADAGADFAAITANTPHLVFDALVDRSPIPLLSIVEVCATEAVRRGLQRLALLGTRFTMEATFYPAVAERQGLAIVTPTAAEREWVHDRYVNQLLRGQFLDETRREFVALIERLHADEGVEGVVLGGTELPLLLTTPEVGGIPLLDTTALHVDAIVQRLRDLHSVTVQGVPRHDHR